MPLGTAMPNGGKGYFVMGFSKSLGVVDGYATQIAVIKVEERTPKN